MNTCHILWAVRQTAHTRISETATEGRHSLCGSRHVTFFFFFYLSDACSYLISAALNLAWPRFSFCNNEIHPSTFHITTGGFYLFRFFLKAMSGVKQERALFVWTDCHAAVIPAVYNKGLFDIHSIMSDCTEVEFQSCLTQRLGLSHETQQHYRQEVALKWWSAVASDVLASTSSVSTSLLYPHLRVCCLHTLCGTQPVWLSCTIIACR